MRRLWALYWIAAIMMLGGLIGMGVMGARALGAAARCQCPSESRSDARPEHPASRAHVPRSGAGQWVGSGPDPIADSAGSQAAWRELDELEARMLWAEERRRAWEELARRHRQVSAIACEQLAEVATAREIR